MEDGLWTGKKRSSKTIDIVSYALKVSVNGVTCVFVAHFRSSGTISMCPPKHVTGNNFILHKALSPKGMFT